MLRIEVGLDWHHRHGTSYFAAFLRSRPDTPVGQCNWLHLVHDDVPMTRDSLSVFRLADGDLSADVWHRAISRAFVSARTVSSVTCHTDIADGAGRRTVAMRFTAGLGVQTLEFPHGPGSRCAAAAPDPRVVLAQAAPAIAAAAEAMAVRQRDRHPVIA